MLSPTSREHQTIHQAALLVNAQLVARGYADSPLLFVTTDKDALLRPDDPFLDAAPASDHATYANDKNVLNVLHALLQDVADAKRRETDFLLAVQAAAGERETWERRVAVLEREARQQLERVAELERGLKLEKAETARVARELAVQTKDAKALRLFNSSLQLRFEVESRKRDVELGRVRDQLQERRAAGLLPARVVLITGNNPSGTPAATTAEAVLSETERMLVDLTGVVSRTVGDNARYAAVCRAVSAWLESAVAGSAPPPLLDPPPRLVDEMVETMEDPDAVWGRLVPLMEKIGARGGSGEEVARLERELAETHRNWQQAIDTMDRWRGARGDA